MQAQRGARAGAGAGGWESRPGCLTWRTWVQGGRCYSVELAPVGVALPTRECLLELVRYRRSDGMRHSDTVADSESRLIATRH